jgi:SET domain-containing protein
MAHEYEGHSLRRARGPIRRFQRYSDPHNSPAYPSTHTPKRLETGERVFIHALTAIAPGQELFIDYGLSVDGALTDDIRTQYMCHCGASACRRTMLGNNAELP